MKSNSRHVILNLDGGWSVKSTGTSRSAKRFKTEAEAEEYARELARRERGVVYLHRRDGSVREKVSF